MQIIPAVLYAVPFDHLFIENLEKVLTLKRCHCLIVVTNSPGINSSDISVISISISKIY